MSIARRLARTLTEDRRSDADVISKTSIKAVLKSAPVPLLMAF